MVKYKLLFQELTKNVTSKTNFLIIIHVFSIIKLFSKQLFAIKIEKTHNYAYLRAIKDVQNHDYAE